ncbi:unnamed protein product [Discula destructiva]
MSSPPQSFRDSSPAGAPGRHRSKFTYRNLAHLASSSTSCPLRVIAHIDLDAFYAQCEMRRLDLADDQPLVVQQWQGLIAVNYPARDKGVARFTDINEAKKRCENLICQHVATWREGEEHWAYRDDPVASTDKVSLDPYRLQSRKILSVVKESLPAGLQKVEKASIDEVFLDLSAQVHAILLERFSELGNPPPYDDPTERLPMPSIAALDWKADALIDLDEEERETDDPDWDDVAILIGSEIVRDVRAAVREKLRYTCSAGVAQNKMLAKLGSGSRKPNGQTVVRNRAIQKFLSGFKFTKIRNLGGKLGDQIVQTFGTDSVGELLLVPVEQLKLKLGDDTGVWVYNTLRGIDHSEVNARVQIKSMLSAKSFRPSINNVNQAVKWLRIFVGDIFSRLVEEGVLENRRRPRTINLHHRHGGQTKSRQGPIPQGKTIDKDMLLDLAKQLLNQIVLEGKVWPCANLSLSVGGFDEGVTGNMGIGAFLVKGEEAQALKRHYRDDSGEPQTDRPSLKQRRPNLTTGIQNFFSKQPAKSRSETASPGPASCESEGSGTLHWRLGDINCSALPKGLANAEQLGDGDHHDDVQGLITPHVCDRCKAGFDDAGELQCHQDEHFAKDLQEKERGGRAFAGHPPSSSTPAAPRRSANKGKQRLETGQSKLKFG